MKVTYEVAVSLDGFIAKPDGDVSWLDEMNIASEETGLDQFFADIDGIVMGRGTYDFIVDYGSWPYEAKPTWICTSRALEVLPGCNRQLATEPQGVVAEAESMNLKHLWLLGGGKLATAFLQAGTLTHLGISVMPILLGEGIRLFDKFSNSVRVSGQKACLKTSGFTRLEYEIQNS